MVVSGSFLPVTNPITPRESLRQNVIARALPHCAVGRTPRGPKDINFLFCHRLAGKYLSFFLPAPQSTPLSSTSAGQRLCAFDGLRPFVQICSGLRPEASSHSNNLV